MRSEPSPTRSRTRGQHTATGPMPVMISRSGRCPWRTSRWRPSSVSLSAWQLSKAATSASIACAKSARAPLRNTSVSGSAKVPGWESWKTLVSVTAYHSFGGEVEASNTPTIRRLIPSCRHQLSPIALDPCTDDIAGPALDGVGGIAIVAHAPSGSRCDIGTRRRDQRIEMRPAGLESFQPPVREPSLEAADERPHPASHLPQGGEHSEALRSGRENPSFPTSLLSCGNPALEIGDGGRHLSVGGKSHTPALDLDGAHPTKACRQQRIALHRHFFEGHA